MKNPRVSIILPTFNSIDFLPQRVDSIINQTVMNWECIVIDGYSSDGTWEYLMNYCCDKRFKFYQFPAIGIYDAWNKGIERACGKLIYIATSDDTMSYQFLERMIGLLDSHPDCDIAQCGLEIINANDEKHHSVDWLKFPVPVYLKEFVAETHKRLAPLDAIIQSSLGIVYSSVTQLLIRKRVFDSVGLFSLKFGSKADWEWEYKASLIANIIYCPEHLATWRIHGSQATNFDKIDTAEHKEDLARMLRRALRGYNRSMRINYLIKFTYRHQAYRLYKRNNSFKMLKYIDMILFDFFCKLKKRDVVGKFRVSYNMPDIILKEMNLLKENLIIVYSE